MKKSFKWNARLLIALVLIAVFFALPFVLGGEEHVYLLNLAAKVMIFSIAAIALDVILGYGGMLSLGQAGLFGIGAYSVSILAFNDYLNGWVQLGLAIVASFVVALIFGCIALRTSGIYFLMISLALGQLLYYTGVGLEQLGGDDGFSISRSVFAPGVSFEDPLLLYYVSFAFFALILLFSWRLVSSPFGMVLRGIHDNERRMLALGFHTFRYKLLAFAMAGAASGLAGALFVNLKAFMSPIYLQWVRSGELVVMVLLGGVGSLVGSVLGVGTATAIEAFLPGVLDDVFHGQGRNWPLVYGALLILIVLSCKGGLLGLMTSRKDRRRQATPVKQSEMRKATLLVDAMPEALDIDAQTPPSSDFAPLLIVEGLCKNYNGLKATSDVSFQVQAGTLHAIIGPNGAGKTTLLAQISGELASDSGRIVYAGKNIQPLPVYKRAHLGIARTYQITSVFGNFTALQNIAVSLQSTQAHKLSMWANADHDVHLQRAAVQILHEIGLSHRADTPCKELAHGEQRRLELGMAIASQPQLLLLDEPMAGIGGSESQDLIRLISKLKRKYTILMVEHDMDAIFQLADQITVLENGMLIATDSPSRIRNNEKVIKAYLGTETLEIAEAVC